MRSLELHQQDTPVAQHSHRHSNAGEGCQTIVELISQLGMPSCLHTISLPAPPAPPPAFLMRHFQARIYRHLCCGPALCTMVQQRMVSGCAPQVLATATRGWPRGSWCCSGGCG